MILCLRVQSSLLVIPVILFQNKMLIDFTVQIIFVNIYTFLFYNSNNKLFSNTDYSINCGNVWLVKKKSRSN